MIKNYINKWRVSLINLNTVWLEALTVGLVGVLSLVSIFVFVFAVVLGFIALIWQLWLFVIPTIFTSAPEIIKHPGYWLFVGCWVLFAQIRNIIKS